MPTTIPNISSTKHEGFKNKKSKKKKIWARILRNAHYS